METYPIYVLKAGKEVSPLLESPLGLFNPSQMGDILEDKYGIPKRRLSGLMSPWAMKRLDEFGGDVAVARLLHKKPNPASRRDGCDSQQGDNDQPRSHEGFLCAKDCGVSFEESIA